MKTVEFTHVGVGNGSFHAWQPNGKTHELAGIYVLASESCERIKVLEEALRKISAWDFDWNLDTVDIARDIAREALEVKP
jgi:hypothetical protein